MKEFLRPMLSNYRWFRKWYGGHWELWWVGSPVNSYIWHDVEKPTPYPWRWDEKPTPICESLNRRELWT